MTAALPIGGAAFYRNDMDGSAFLHPAVIPYNGEKGGETDEAGTAAANGHITGEPEAGKGTRACGLFRRIRQDSVQGC